MRDPIAGGPEARPRFAAPLVLALAALPLLAQLLTAGRFGIFRDELYYLACADHLAWGYVDHPPLSVALLAAVRGILGESVHALRLPVMLIAAAVPVAGALLARELGGRRFAQGLVALCLAIAPIVLVLGGFHSMNALELLLWLLGALLLARRSRSESPRLWLALGIVIGLGLLNKLSFGVFALSLTGALLLDGQLKRVLSPGFGLCVLVAALIFLPHVIWQLTHDWPILEFASNAQRNKIAVTGPLGFVAENALELHPFNLLVWLPGLVWLFTRGARPFRPLAWLFLLSLVLMLLQRTKPYYLTPAYLILMAAGARAVEGFTRERGRPWARPALVGFLVLGGLATSPMALPLLSPRATADYLRATHLSPNTGETGHRNQALPQYFADRFAWREQVEAVAMAWDSLSEEERQSGAILCANYGQAGAIVHFGRERGLPQPCCGHNSFYDWWPEDAVGESAIALGFKEGDLRGLYEEVETVETLDLPFAMPGEGHARILRCRGLKYPLSQARPQFRYFG